MRYLFLVCSERSGSNLLTRLFNAHPEVCGPPPTHIGSDLLANLHRYPGWQGPERDGFLRDFMGLFGAKMGDWTFQLTSDWLERQINNRGPVGAYLSLYAEEARLQGKPVVFIKENRLYEWAPALATVDVNISWLYQCRDPRDMALSWKKAPAIRGGILRAARTWQKDQEGSLALLAQIRASTQRQVPWLRYEDLIDAPDEVLKSVCRQLDLDYDPVMLNFHRSEAIASQASRIQEWKNIASPILKGNHAKYRNELDAEEIEAVEAICGESMKALGYVSDYPTVSEKRMKELLTRLEPEEPWTKPAYDRLSAVEKERRRRQQEVFSRIRSRPIGVPPGGSRPA